MREIKVVLGSHNYPNRAKSEAKNELTQENAFITRRQTISYTADSKNFSAKKILSDAQMIILKEIRHQIEQSRNAWEESASWQARRINIEKQ